MSLTRYGRKKSIWEAKTENGLKWVSKRFETDIRPQTMIKCRIDNVNDFGTKMVGMSGNGDGVACDGFD